MPFIGRNTQCKTQLGILLMLLGHFSFGAVAIKLLAVGVSPNLLLHLVLKSAP